MHSLRFLLGVTALSGCAGVYAEVSTTRMTSAQIESAGTSTDVGGTTIGFNVGAEFGSTRQRFTMGYAADSISFDGGKASFSGAAMRYDFNLVQLAERLKLRAGFGFEAGKDSSTIAGMTNDRGNGGTYMAGLDATYFVRWANAIHVFVGAAYQTHDLAMGSFSGSGVTARVAISHTFGDPRASASFVVPLEGNRDLTGAIEAGARSLGCTTDGRERTEYMASLSVTCSGGREIEYFQIAEGIMVTCRHAQTKDRCAAWSSEIVRAATERHAAPVATPPAPAPTEPATEPAQPAGPAQAPAPAEPETPPAPASDSTQPAAGAAAQGTSP
jgi:hypothetical protein